MPETMPETISQEGLILACARDIIDAIAIFHDGSMNKRETLETICQRINILSTLCSIPQ